MRISSLALAAVLLLSPLAASAAEKDNAALAAAVEHALRPEAPPNAADAAKKLRALIDKCKSCGGSELARGFLAIGHGYALGGAAGEAKSAFVDGLTYDPDLALPANAPAASVQAFEEAKKAWAEAPSEVADARRAGWVLKDAYAKYKEAALAGASKKAADCIAKAKDSITLEDNPHTRFLLARCEEKTGALVDALRDHAKALERAKQLGDKILVGAIEERATQLVPRLAHIRFVEPPGVSQLKLSFDGKEIPAARLVETFTIDPGTHKLHAEGLLRGARVQTDDTYELREGEIKTATITLRPVALTEGQLACMVNAKTQFEIAQCLPQEQKALVAHAGLEVSGYTDSLDVHVLSPAIRGSIASPTRGWNVGASYLVDVVSAASPDVVSTASRHFYDVRHGIALTGGYKPGNFGAQVSGNYSQERDYISRTVGITGIADLREKMITPSLGYSFTWNTIGRSDTDYDVFSHRFDVHDITAASTFILDPKSVLVLGAELAFETGDQSKPYRYIPLFEPGVTVPVGASIDEVNGKRLPVKPLEQLPLDRQRLALTGRYVLRLKNRATLRFEERVYRDTWAIMATTTDARLLVDLGTRVRVGPHLHVHAQTPAKFYRRIYGAVLDADGYASIPEFRTSDRELSPMFGVTAGGTGRLVVAGTEKIELAVFASADALYNRYLDSLYVKDRIAGYGTIGVEADFE